MQRARSHHITLCTLFALAFLLVTQAPTYGQHPDLTGLLLTWQNDPTTTMTIDWHYYVGASGASSVDPGRLYRPVGAQEWLQAEGQLITPSLLRGRARFRTELTGLRPHTTYEFRLAEYDRTFRFRTVPTDLTEPLRFASGGDTMRDHKDWMEEMNRVVMEYDPEFIVWGGDLAHADDVMPDRWMQWYEAIMNTLIAADGRVVPIITAIGNHEVRDFSYQNHPGFEPTDEWRQRIALFFYGLLAWPGHPGYGVRLAFEHHDHAYKRTVPILAGQPHEGGIVLIGDGGWGVPTRDVHAVESTWYLARAESIRSSLIVSLTEDAAHILALSHAGDVIDEYTVHLITK